VLGINNASNIDLSGLLPEIHESIRSAKDMRNVWKKDNMAEEVGGKRSPFPMPDSIFIRIKVSPDKCTEVRCQTLIYRETFMRPERQGRKATPIEFSQFAHIELTSANNCWLIASVARNQTLL